jgi:hypothetical protein
VTIVAPERPDNASCEESVTGERGEENDVAGKKAVAPG